MLLVLEKSIIVGFANDLASVFTAIHTKYVEAYLTETVRSIKSCLERVGLPPDYEGPGSLT